MRPLISSNGVTSTIQQFFISSSAFLELDSATQGGAQPDSRCLLAARLRVECPTQKTRELRTRPCQLGLQCSVRYSQNLCCFTRGQIVQVTQLESSAQRRRKLLGELHQALMQFCFSVLLLRTRRAVHQPLRHRLSLLLSELLVERYVNLPWSSPQLHPSTIADDDNEPRRHLRLPSELLPVFVSGEECILNRILCVGLIAQVSISGSVEQRQITRENVLRFPSFLFCRRSVEVLFASYICGGGLQMVFSSSQRPRKAAPFRSLARQVGAYFQRSFLVGPVSDKTRHERPNRERTPRVVAVTRHFDVGASCIGTRVGAVLDPSGYIAQTRYVCALSGLLIRHHEFILSTPSSFHRHS